MKILSVPALLENRQNKSIKNLITDGRECLLPLVLRPLKDKVFRYEIHVLYRNTTSQKKFKKNFLDTMRGGGRGFWPFFGPNLQKMQQGRGGRAQNVEK